MLKKGEFVGQHFDENFQFISQEFDFTEKSMKMRKILVFGGGGEGNSDGGGLKNRLNCPVLKGKYTKWFSLWPCRLLVPLIHINKALASRQTVIPSRRPFSTSFLP